MRAVVRAQAFFVLRNWSWTYSFRCNFNVYPRVQGFKLNRQYFVFQRIQAVRVKAIGACHQFFVAASKKTDGKKDNV